MTDLDAVTLEKLESERESRRSLHATSAQKDQAAAQDIYAHFFSTAKSLKIAPPRSEMTDLDEVTLEKFEREQEFRRSLHATLVQKDRDVAKDIYAELFSTPKSKKTAPRCCPSSELNTVRCTQCDVRPSANWQAHVAFDELKSSGITLEHTAPRDFDLFGACLKNMKYTKQGQQAAPKESSQDSSQSSSRRSSRSAGSSLHSAGNGVIQSGGKVYHRKC